MIEDKIKQEYEWQHREIGQPTLDELFSKINEALGIELWIWQKTYREDCERQQLREIYQKLNEAGIQTRKVFWSREEKRRWYESQTVEKEL